MTAPQLLGYIGWAALIQLVLWGALGVWLSRRRRLHPALPDAAPLVGWRPFRVVRRVLEDPEGSQCSFYLAPLDGEPLPDFRPGQFLTVSVNVAGEGRPVVRCYSLSSRPDPGEFRITVKRALSPPTRPDLPPGLCSGHLHDHVQVGDTLGVRGPSGAFCLDPDPDLPVMLIAGGVGITPMVSMLGWLAQATPQRRVHLVQAVQNGAVHAFRSELEAVFRSCPAFHQTVVYARPMAGDVLGRDYDRDGYVDLALLQPILDGLGRCAVYVCGPAPMMEALVPALRLAGVAEADLHHEAFGPASVPRPAGLSSEVPVHGGLDLPVRFLRSGRTLDWSGEAGSLLDFAESNGVAIDSGCRAGQCGSCETRLVSGEVRNLQTPVWEVAPGYCLPCICTPASAVELDA
ncbi:MAG: 2Fe-2S iron-sulfur cluster binding domain-containing protein [Caulobacteraceae bacterium]|nr:2Fe-2S iron-sulfur cluster binding domain-containing protein [Caulobacteraceae bacterium]